MVVGYCVPATGKLASLRSYLCKFLVYSRFRSSLCSKNNIVNVASGLGGKRSLFCCLARSPRLKLTPSKKLERQSLTKIRHFICKKQKEVGGRMRRYTAALIRKTSDKKRIRLGDSRKMEDP